MFLISHPRQMQNNLKQELWTKKNKKPKQTKKTKTTTGDNKNEDLYAPYMS